VATSLTLEEIGQRARRLYDEQLRAVVETPDNLGKFITLDVLSGDYEIGRNLIETAFAVKERHSDPVTCTLRIGYPATFTHGCRRKPIAS
jgi:hypothetical protein